MFVLLLWSYQNTFKNCVPFPFTHALISALLFTVGILLFPAGMNQGEVKVFCGARAGRFKLGDCQLGWAFIIIIMGTGVALVATCMSWCTIRWREKHRDNQRYSVWHVCVSIVLSVGMYTYIRTYMFSCISPSVLYSFYIILKNNMHTCVYINTLSLLAVRMYNI